jgi:radical SAM superfamily enzyme YgiQ (UPF0313 family)
MQGIPVFRDKRGLGSLRITMRYEGVVYRPPSEANSMIIQVTLGCPHNRCSFCGMYRSKRYRVRPLEEVLEDLAEAREVYGEGVTSFFFADGNTIAVRTDYLEKVFRETMILFPKCERITLYGSAKFINRKSVEDLRRLKEAGLSRIHSGLESGDGETLLRINKGITPEEAAAAGTKVMEAGISLSEYILVGIAGKERSREHARGSADVLNKINPDFIRLRTYVPLLDTPLGNEYQEGTFSLLGPHDAIRETLLLIENLEVDSLLLSDHISNYCNVQGKLPGDKPKMMEILKRALQCPEDSFRPAVIEHL